MNEFIIINDKYFLPEKALLPIIDNGFLFGDGLFETLRGYKGNIFAIDLHLDRLFSSMHELKFNTGFFSMDYIKSAAGVLLVKNGLLKCDSYIKIIAARSSYKDKMIFDQDSKPNLLLIAKRLSPYPENYYQNGIAAFTSSNKRTGTGNNIYKHKLINYFENILAKNEAAANQAQEALFAANDKTILEGATSNIFAVKDNMIFTAPLTQNILPGITRQIVIEICKKNKMKFSEKKLRYFNLVYADEIFLTNSIMEIMPVKKIDDYLIGSGNVPGKITSKIHAFYKTLTAY
jgi:D-amino acid aminotransferase